MALSADKPRNHRGYGHFTKMVIGTADTIYVGSLVNRRNTTGRAFAATAATGRKIAGVAVELVGADADGLGDTSGNEQVIVEYLAEYEFTVDTAIRTNTSLGLNVFVDDDDKVAGTDVGTAGTRVPVGELVAWVDETGTDKSLGWVAIRRFATTNIAV